MSLCSCVRRGVVSSWRRVSRRLRRFLAARVYVGRRRGDDVAARHTWANALSLCAVGASRRRRRGGATSTPSTRWCAGNDGAPPPRDARTPKKPGDAGCERPSRTPCAASPPSPASPRPPRGFVSRRPAAPWREILNRRSPAAACTRACGPAGAGGAAPARWPAWLGPATACLLEGTVCSPGERLVAQLSNYEPRQRRRRKLVCMCASPPFSRTNLYFWIGAYLSSEVINKL